APFDGVLGFSQGAALAALLVGVAAMERAAAGATGSPLAFDFAVMVGGFVSADAEHAPLYQALRAAEVPSLHVIGRADRVVSPEASRALAARFAGARVVEHDGGHVMAAT